MILVTGASGLLGSAVCRVLRSKGIPYFAHLGSGRGKTTVPRDVREYATLRAAGDLCDREHVETLFRYDLWPAREHEPLRGVIHCAARISGVEGQKADPSFAVTDNLVMSARVMEAAAKSKLVDTDGYWGRFIFVSSSTVYPAERRAMDEYDELKPADLYEGVAGAKLYLERLLRFYRNKFGMRFAVLRPTAIIGEMDQSNHVMPDLIQRALKSGVPEITVDGANDVRDFVDAADVAEACVLAARGLGREGVVGPFNVGSGKATSIEAAAKLVLRTVYPDKEPLVRAGGPGHAIPYRQVSLSRIKTAFGWEPRVPLEDSVRRMVERCRRS